jgi:DNA helicase HerA-like ATPase
MLMLPASPFSASVRWVSQFLMTLSRWTSQHPSDKLQLAVLFDEADMYLPAQRQPATKPLMEDLLKRARSAGVSVMLATQSPGDLDYKCRDNIKTWFVGRVKEKTALDKLKPMLSECQVDISSKLPVQQTGEFHMLQDGNVSPFRADQSLLKTRQLSEQETLKLAKACSS